jgi:hypothetical protein
MSPSVTRRPNIDAMLGDISVIAQHLLGNMRRKIAAGAILDESELRQFRETAETILRQTRVEIEVEKHIASRTSSMSAEQIRDSIVEALEKKNVEPDVIDIVLDALGMAA